MPFDLHTVNTKPRLLTVSKSLQNLPMIIVSGAWFGRWGFTIGNRLSIYCAGNGCMLLKTEPVLESDDRSYGCRQVPTPVTTLPVLRKRMPHYLTISESCRYCPQLKIAGAWLRNWGIITGDRIRVTKEADGIFSIKVVVPAAEWAQLQKNKEVKREEANALSVLKKYKVQYPDLFEQVANSKKRRAAPVKPMRPVQPFPYDHTLTAGQRYTAAVAAQSADYNRAG
jgi:hypothetical protein